MSEKLKGCNRNKIKCGIFERKSVALIENSLEYLLGSDEQLWEALLFLQGSTFYTRKGLPFTYQIKGYEMFISRKEKSLTKATVLLAFHHAVQLQKNGCIIDGPKKLGTFGASYLYPIFIELGIIAEQPRQE